MRLYYYSLSGLWSKDKSIALPCLQRTLLESPAFATMYWVGVISTTLAVHPVDFDIGSLSGMFLKALSSLVAA